MKENKLLTMAQCFAIAIIKTSAYLKSIGQNAIADQIKRSGTSIFANIAEGNYPQSRLDMISKFEIALKEANEAENWLVVCHESALISNDPFVHLHKHLIQIKILLISSIRTLKTKLDS